MYGKAFDVVRLSDSVNLDDLADCERGLGSIRIYEVKSTKKNLPADFRGFFFALTGAEMLVAQSLKEQFGFVFVNTTTGDYLEAKLGDVFARARGIYPTWSICF